VTEGAFVRKKAKEKGVIMRILLAGNWKMFGLGASLAEIRALGRALTEEAPSGEIVVCPPATLLTDAARAAAGTCIAIGGQNCHVKPSGAFTGDIAAEMLRDAGADYVILGHSERRQFHGETDVEVAEKVQAARRAGLTPIVCIGESESERHAGQAVQVVTAQLAGSLPQDAEPAALVIAYEPVWAIGTGLTPTVEQIEEMHAAIRDALTQRFGEAAAKIRILYGGSVKPANAAEILGLKNVNGALVGGASLKAADFLAIIRAAPKRA
jgi:triosephosphate isomerase